MIKQNKKRKLIIAKKDLPKLNRIFKQQGKGNFAQELLDEIQLGEDK
jgi:hypothetical protein